MTASTLFLLSLGAVGVILAAFLYLRRELPLRGRGALLALRTSALLIVVLLLLNPGVPGTDPDRAVEGGGWVLLDAELALLADGPDGAALWDAAVELTVQGVREGRRPALLTAGAEAVVGIDTLSLRSMEPAYPGGDPEAAVRRLSEIGADSVLLVSTLRYPRATLERLVDEASVPLRIERVGGAVGNVGIGELELPPRVRADEELHGVLSIFGEGEAVGRTVGIEVLVNGELLLTVPVTVPPPGATAREALRLPPAGEPGTLRVVVRSTADDDFPIDDERAAVVTVGEPEGGLVLVSLRPDWEPRLLLPELERATGLEGAGFLGLTGGRWLPIGTEIEGVTAVEEALVRSRLEDAELLVVHGAAGALPPWLAAVVDRHPRLLYLAADAEGADAIGVVTSPPSGGEWVLEPELPPSPVSPLLTGLRLGGLPPLSGLLRPTEEVRGEAVLHARGSSVGSDGTPVLLLREAGDRRTAIGLAQGFWRWGVREGEAREAYRGLWSGVAGWLLERPGVAGGPPVRPESPIQPRGADLRWRVAPSTVSARVELRAVGVPEGSDPLVTAELTSGPDGMAGSPSMPPGRYDYLARVVEEGSDEEVTVTGTVEVEGWAASLRRPPLEVDAALAEAAREATAIGATPSTRPLRTHLLPYIALLLLLCAEWIGRRRLGLR